MTNTYLLEIIKAFSPAKRKEMALFLASPYFNRGKKAQQINTLYRIILDAAPEFSDTVLSKERVYSLLFSKPDINSGSLERLIAELNQLLRSFALTQQYFSGENIAEQQLDWTRWLRKNGLAEPARKAVFKMLDHQQTDQEESIEHYYLKFLTAEEAHLWEMTHNKLKGDLNLPNLINNLDLYYLNYRTELENRYLLQQKGSQLPDLQLSMVAVDLRQDNSVLLQISSGIRQILSKSFPSVEEFNELMQLLQQKEKVLSFDMQAQFYAYLRSTCTLLINGGNLAFIPVLHNINKDNLERGYFLIKGEIAPNPYINLVQVATRAKEFGWAKAFTEQYKKRILGGDDDAFFYRFNMAHCLFAEGNFDAALSQIPEASSNSHYLHLLRLLELKIYYELRSDLLEYKIDAFRKYTVRTATKTIAANLRSMDINFLNILTQLSHSPSKDKTRSERLLQRIHGKKLLADRAWLIEKAKALG